MRALLTNPLATQAAKPTYVVPECCVRCEGYPKLTLTLTLNLALTLTRTVTRPQPYYLVPTCLFLSRSGKRGGPAHPGWKEQGAEEGEAGVGSG